jgi:hypothetical protein
MAWWRDVEMTISEILSIGIQKMILNYKNSQNAVRISPVLSTRGFCASLARFGLKDGQCESQAI